MVRVAAGGGGESGLAAFLTEPFQSHLAQQLYAVKTQNPSKGKVSHGLSRRMFTKEFKLAAVQRLEGGSLIGEVARALEVNPNVLHR